MTFLVCMTQVQMNVVTFFDSCLKPVYLIRAVAKLDVNQSRFKKSVNQLRFVQATVGMFDNSLFEKSKSKKSELVQLVRMDCFI